MLSTAIRPFAALLLLVALPGCTRYTAGTGRGAAVDDRADQQRHRRALYHNQHDGRFREVGAAAHAHPRSSAMGVAWGD